MIQREQFIFGKGWVHSSGVLYFYGATRDMNEADDFESVVLRCERGKWSFWQIGTRLCNVVTQGQGDSHLVACIGIDGYVEILKGQARRVEAVDRSRDGPNRLKHLTFARTFGERILTVGMSRMVYERNSGASWRAIDSGLRIPRSSPEIEGLRAIEVDDNGDLVAVGLRGDIWFRQSEIWRAIESPTNLKLESLRWLNGVLYICGGRGLLLHGQPDKLKIITQTATEDTFWSMESFGGEIFLSTRRGSIWKLIGEELVRVELAGGPDVSTGWLHANEGLLLSVGERDIFTNDGHSWTRLKPPTDASWPFEW